MRPSFLLPPHEAEMISFKCAGCQAPFNVSDDKAGKSGKCPKCMTPFTVPTPVKPQPRDEDEGPPRKKAARPRDEDEEDDRPRKKPRREEIAEDEDRPSKKRRAEDEDRPAKRRTPKGVLSPLDRALRAIRRSQFLDLAAAGTLLLVGIVAAVMLAVVANSKQEAKAAEWEQRSSEWSEALRQWNSTPPHLRNTRGPRPEWPSDLPKWKPSAGNASRDMLSANGWMFLLFAIPASAVAASGVLSAVGRFRMAGLAGGSGGGRGFAAVGVLAVGRSLLGLLSVGGCVWAMTQVGADTDIRERGPELIAGAMGGLVLAMYVGVLGEVFALPALALAGWYLGTDDRQRHRIGSAAAFYPVVVVAWFLLSLVFGAVGFFVPSLIAVVGGIQGFLFLVIQVLQYLVVSRAYRFPSTVDRVN